MVMKEKNGCLQSMTSSNIRVSNDMRMVMKALREQSGVRAEEGADEVLAHSETGNWPRVFSGKHIHPVSKNRLFRILIEHFLPLPTCMQRHQAYRCYPSAYLT